MAISDNARFSNAMQGVPQVGVDFDPYESNSTAKWALGTGLEDQRGNKYRYVHFGAAVNPGVIVAQDFSESSKDESSNYVVAPASAVAIADESISAGKIGSRFVEMSLGSVTLDQYAGGDLCITSDTGAGFAYRIKGNTITGNPATGTFRMELYKPLASGLDATSEVVLAGSRYANCEIATAATDNDIAGVSMNYQTAGTFGWVCSKGRATILRDATTIAQGDMLALSTNIDGSVQVCGDNNLSLNDAIAGTQIVGYAVSIGQAAGSIVAQINVD